MFRISHFMHGLVDPGLPIRAGKPTGPVVIWNLIRRCNLTCKHCYSVSADTNFKGELTTAEAETVMDDLRAFGVPVLILSGGEPLMRPDIYHLSERARSMGFYVALSSNGTLIDGTVADRLAGIGYDYVGISIDGIGDTHDRFRRMPGAFEASMRAVRLCRDRGIKVGLRFTLTEDNAADLPRLLELVQVEGIDKFYLSHLNYAGRGRRNAGSDAAHALTRWAMELLFEAAWQDACNGVSRDYVTGNNDADGVYLLHWARRRPELDGERLLERLRAWGGNSTGINIANIDNTGVVHPDSFWWHYPLGNVRDRPFSEIWSDRTDPLVDQLKSNPRPLRGRCATCGFVDVCNGNTRIRAYQGSGDYWAEDPGCYLSDAEIGLAETMPVSVAG